jgi:hypothetical protein
VRTSVRAVAQAARRPTCALCLLAALLLGACGSSARTSTGADDAKGGDAANTTATGTVDGAAHTSAATPAPGGCAATVASTLGEVGERIYREAGSGGNVEQAVHRVRGSIALASAIENGDASAARAALRGLLVNQIVRIQIVRDGQVFAAAGSGPAIAPVRGSIPDTDASFVLSVQADHAYTQVTKQVTGAEIVLLGAGHVVASTLAGIAPANVPADGELRLGGKSYRVHSLNGKAFPSSPLRIALLVPASAISCHGPAEQARVQTLGHVGERIYQQEQRSPYTLATLHHVEADAAFRRAVADRDVAATRAAIVSFFAAHIHVVRVRVTVPADNGGERLLIDLGGPYVLAPVHGALHSDGKRVGRFTMAIQDDAGYLRLARLFTGAEVLMRTGKRQVMGTLDPGPATVPTDPGSASGAVSYEGHDYEAYSFTAEAFPSGPLRISLLFET